MKLLRRWIDDPPGELVRPERAEEPLPAVLLIHELWGLDDHIRDLAGRFASAGYLAFAPDLFHPAAPEIAPERTRALETFFEETPPEVWSDPDGLDKRLREHPDGAALAETRESLMAVAADRPRHLERLEQCVAWLREQAPAVGSVGWCMGGGLSGRLAATATPPDAAVVFYGAPPEPELHERIAAPLLGFVGSEDARLMEYVEPFTEAMRTLRKEYEVHVYPGAPHAFFNDTRSFYRVAAARDAWARTLAFFAERLAA